MAFLDTCESIAPWSAITQTANVATSATRILGSASLSFDKDGTGAAEGTIGRTIMAFDAYWLRLLGYSLRFRFRHANWTNVSSLFIDLVYQWGDSSRLDTTSPFSADRYSVTYAGGLSASAGAWGSTTIALTSGSAQGVTPTDALRQKVVGLRLGVVMGAAANTITSVLVDGIEIVPSASGRSRLSTLEWDSTRRHRLLLPTFDTWNRNPHPQAIVHEAEAAVARVFVSNREQFEFGLRNVMNATAREGLRRWAQYAMANDDWGVARDGLHIVSTTLDAASGAGENDPRKLNLTDTTTIELLHTTLGESTYLLVGPNSSRQYELAKVASISAGSYVILRDELAYTYASGDYCRSGHENGGLNYLPAAALVDAAAIQVSDSEWSLHAVARDTL